MKKKEALFLYEQMVKIRKFEEEDLIEFNPIENCEELLSTFVDKVAP